MSTSLRPAPSNNVVPMPTAAPPSPLWPMPQITPGCCPPGGMDALMKCYCDIQAATAFICAVMVDCINTNPAVTEAIIAAIEKSGSSLPTIGVTDGSNAQPGQVGEFIEMIGNFSFPQTSQVGLPVTIGVLPPGDWDCSGFVGVSEWVSNLQFVLNPVPAGFTNAMSTLIAMPSGIEAVTLVLPEARASLTVPTLVVGSITTNNVGNGSAAGTGAAWFMARRRR